MRGLVQGLRHLHRAPDHWSLGEYTRHARKITLSIWGMAVVGCLALGLATGDLLRPYGEAQPFTIYTAAGLAICSFVCGQCARLTGGGARRLWTLMATGFVYLAADDLFKIHENIDHVLNRLLGFAPDNPVADHADDAIVALYAGAGLLVVYHQRVHVRELLGFVPGVKRAMGSFAAMVVLDAIEGHLQGVPRGATEIAEESFKGLAISLLFMTFVTARFQLRRQARGLPVEVAPGDGAATAAERQAK